tara:strand:+ start:489 stop:1373 length:885 start_codon:yes stop_codon:yes gene_type:complete
MGLYNRVIRESLLDLIAKKKMLYKSYIFGKMCNIYKNNLMLLSQLEEDQFIYYDSENNLKIDNRILGYLRNGTKENKISIIINSSFMHILNSYIINLVSHEKMESHEGVQLLEIENTKLLLRNALKGIQKYYETLVKNNYHYQDIENLNSNLNKKYENIEEYKTEYLIKINDNTSTPSTSKSWLYQIYESTLKPECKKPTVIETTKLENESSIDENTNSTEDSSTINNNDNNTSHSESQNINHTEPEEEQLGNYFPETLDEDEEPGFMHGILYIFSKKIIGLFFTIGKHVSYFF